jgi:uncharacterized damage-inducible protein DinB
MMGKFTLLPRETTMEALKYPVGRFDRSGTLSPDERTAMIDSIAAAPARLRQAVAGLDDAQLDTPYREGGWTVRQVVHHVPDSHANAYIRLRTALTETNPTIRPYAESEWAKLPDASSAPIGISLDFLEILHVRFVLLWRALGEEEFQRTFVHPDAGQMTVEHLLRLYEWHGRHHTAHITGLRERMGWT